MCVDIGSTYTKGVLVDTSKEDPWVATTAVPTTNPLVGTGQDVVEGLDQVKASLLAEHYAKVSPAQMSPAQMPPADAAEIPTFAASSAGGGLRIAVVGYEPDVTAEAGRRAALSAGGKITQVHAGLLSEASVVDVVGDDTDLILLVGGTDGGNAHVLVQNAALLGKAQHDRQVKVPMVVAGNSHAHHAVVSALTTGVADMSLVAVESKSTLRALQTGRSESTGAILELPDWVVLADNVLPVIGTYEPESARLAIRESFLRHVIRGKGLSTSERFVTLVRGATPDMVLRGVEVLAQEPWPNANSAGTEPGQEGSGHSECGDDPQAKNTLAQDVLVVDVGGATTDVYSAITPEGEDASLRKEVVAPAWHTRTVEGDLGMRWSAATVVAAAQREALLGEDCDELRQAAIQRSEDPAREYCEPGDREIDLEIARLAVTCALRRHARPVNATKAGRDLRNVGIVVGSGGVLRHHGAAAAQQILAPASQDHAGGWRVPRSPETVVDSGNRLLAAGLLADSHPQVAARIARGLRAHRS